MNFKDKTTAPVFITGVERSGSSLVARILEMCGVFTGPITPMYENKDLKKQVDVFYHRINKDPRGQYPLPSLNDLNYNVVGWALDTRKTIQEQGCNDERLWMYKSSRIAQIWPLWFYAFPSAKWVIVRRRTPDVINSCQQTAFMNAYKNEAVLREIKVKTEEDGWLWWVHYHEQRFREIIEAGANVKIIWPERMRDGDYRQIYETIEWLGLKWTDRILNFVNEMIK